jgi:hypothetical protein
MSNNDSLFPRDFRKAFAQAARKQNVLTYPTQGCVDGLRGAITFSSLHRSSLSQKNAPSSPPHCSLR